VVEAIQNHCWVQSGYSGLKDVNEVRVDTFLKSKTAYYPLPTAWMEYLQADGEKTNEQPTFFLAETLKYLYLLFRYLASNSR
jgi:hypothetical protein